jgi:hypothetical protein
LFRFSVAFGEVNHHPDAAQQAHLVLVTRWDVINPKETKSSNLGQQPLGSLGHLVLRTRRNTQILGPRCVRDIALEIEFDATETDLARIKNGRGDPLGAYHPKDRQDDNHPQNVRSKWPAAGSVDRQLS